MFQRTGNINQRQKQEHLLHVLHIMEKQSDRVDDLTTEWRDFADLNPTVCEIADQGEQIKQAHRVERQA